MSLDVNLSEPDEFNCTELHTCIKQVADTRGVNDFVYHVDYICGKGENYIANIFRVFIKETGNEDNNFSVVIKTLINTTRQELFHELHKREVIAYETVISKFIEMQNPLNDELKVVLCECVYSSIEKSNEVMILKDMDLEGFVPDNKLARYEKLDHDQVTTVLSELAKFHALSFIFEKRDPDLFNQTKLELEDVLFQNKFLNKSKLRNYFYESYEMSVNLIANVEVKRKLEEMKDKVLEILQMYSRSGKRNVICHGDCWINNILFKYEENKPTKVCFIDFQAMRYANPVTDIVYFLYLCTDSKYRSEHLCDVQNIYYDSLKSFLSHYDIDVNDVYTKNDFEEDLKEYRPFGLLIALIELRIISVTPENEAILKGSNIVSDSDQSVVPGESDFMKFRVNDLINESIENGVLDQFFSLIKR